MKYLLLSIALALATSPAQANPIAIAIAIAEAEADAPKVKPAPKPAPVKSVIGRQYNTRPRKGYAYVEPNTYSAYVNHLASDIHGFERSWLVTQTSQQLFALHSDAHNNCVDEAKAVRPTKQLHASTRLYTPPAVRSSGCPNGQCAKPQRRFFR
jgi:hypothetical protein